MLMGSASGPQREVMLFTWPKDTYSPSLVSGQRMRPERSFRPVSSFHVCTYHRSQGMVTSDPSTLASNLFVFACIEIVINVKDLWCQSIKKTEFRLRSREKGQGVSVGAGQAVSTPTLECLFEYETSFAQAADIFHVYLIS